ncbi:MAG: hypothetical protein ACXABY_00135 [Candidatus Thorarchaeota archaeon]|jgi:hypothetical protein
MHSTFIIFRCDVDDCWVVSKWNKKGKFYLGVAECPDKETAEKVLEALEVRRLKKKLPLTPYNVK